MLRKQILRLAFVVAAAPAAALVQPQRINFQGKLLNPSTNNPQAGPVTLTFNLYNVPTGGSPLYTETQSNVPLTNGVFSVEIGSQTAIPRDLFLGASVYLGVTVSGDSEMLPRQNLVMSAYAYTANQLSDLNEVRLIAGPTYSTFTSAGNLTVPGGVVASSGSFTNGITASSGTFTQSGGDLFSIVTTSGIQMNNGTLDVTGTAGIDASDTGIWASTATIMQGLYMSTSTLGCSTAGCGSAMVVWLLNAKGASVPAGSIVTAVSPLSFTTIGTAETVTALGVVFGPNACPSATICPIAIEGVVWTLATAAVTAGDCVVTGATAGEAEAVACSAAAPSESKIGRWLSTGGGAGIAEPALLH